MDWTIYSYHNVQALRGVLNAIAMATGAGDFKASVVIVLIFGFFAAMVAYAVAPQKMQGWQWLASVTLVYAVLFLPKAQVQLMDVTAQEPPAVVGNVPFGLALLAGGSSQVGHVLTGLFETAFSSIPGDGPVSRPEELSYQRNGLMFGARLINASQNFAFGNAEFRSDMTEFLSNCVATSLASGDLDVETIRKSTNLWRDIEPGLNPARFSVLANAGANDVLPCTDVYRALGGRMANEVQNVKATLAYNMHPGLPGAEATTRIDSEITAAYASSWLVDASYSASDVIAQNAMINSFKDGSALDFVRSGDTSGLLMNQAMSTTYRQKNSAFITNAKIAEQALPVIRNVIEAVTYALFPLLVLLMFLTTGRDTIAAFRNYATVLIWIQLWPPLYAVLNFMAGIYASYDLAAAGVIDPASASRGVALATLGAINDNALSSQAVVGYLTFTIPVIAWSALKRMENLGTTLAGALNGLQSTGDANAGSASIGNLTSGSVLRNQANVSPSRNNPGVDRWQGDDATSYTRDVHGNVTHQMAVNSGPVTTKQTISWAQAKTAALGHDVQLAENQRKSRSEEAVAALRASFGYSRGVGNSDRASHGAGSGFSQQGTESFQKLDNLLGGYAKRLNLPNTAEIREGLGVKIFGTGAEYSGGAGVQKALEKINSAFETKEHSVGRGFTKSLMEDARREVATLRDEGTKVGKDSSLLDSLVRSAQSDVAYGEAVKSMEESRNSAVVDYTTTLDLSTLDGEAAFKQLTSRSMGMKELAEWVTSSPFSMAQKMDIANLLAGKAAPHMPPAAAFTTASGKVVTNSKDMSKAYQETDPADAHLKAGDRAAVAAQDTQNQSAVAANGGPDARRSGHVQGSNARGVVIPEREGGNVMRQIGTSDGGVLTPEQRQKLPTTIGDLSKNPEEFEKRRKELEQEQKALEEKAIKGIPTVGRGPDGELAIHSKTRDILMQQGIERWKAGEALNVGVGALIDERAMATALVREQGRPVTFRSVLEGVDQIRKMKQKAASGDAGQQAHLDRLRPPVEFANTGVLGLPDISMDWRRWKNQYDNTGSPDWSGIGSEVKSFVSGLIPSSARQAVSEYSKAAALHRDRIRSENPGITEFDLSVKTQEALRSDAIFGTRTSANPAPKPAAKSADQ